MEVPAPDIGQILKMGAANWALVVVLFIIVFVPMVLVLRHLESAKIATHLLHVLLEKFIINR
jgi:hypothetical protein